MLMVGAVAARVAGAAEPAEAVMPSYGRWHSCQIGGGGYLMNVVACPSNPSRYFANVDVGGVFRSDDGGNRWRMLNGPLGATAGANECRSVSVDPRDDRRLVIAVGSQWTEKPLGVYISDDAGDSWQRTLQTEFAGNGDTRMHGLVLARDPAHSDVLLAAALRDGVFRSEGNGRTWQHCAGADGLEITDVRFDRTDGNRAWLCAVPMRQYLHGKQFDLKGGFYLSSDGGRNWVRQSESSPPEIVQDPQQPQRIYGFADEKRCQVSVDDGAAEAGASDE
jgi:photosystem II stability/assembly factor-like uncharacterized protein